MRRALTFLAALLAMATTTARADTPQSAHAFFIGFDRDGDGRLSRREYGLMLRSLDDAMRTYFRIPRGAPLPREFRAEHPAEPFSRYDLNGDGFISEEEAMPGITRDLASQPPASPPIGNR